MKKAKAVYLNTKLVNLTCKVDEFFYIENWLPIKGYVKRYEISDFGRIRTAGRWVKDRLGRSRFRYPIIKKQTISAQGYLLISLNDLKKHETFTVHRLVIRHFLSENTKNDIQVNHKNGSKIDNHITNLEWVTSSENQKHAYRIGLRSQLGQNHASAKLTNIQAMEIFNSDMRVTDLANKYSITMTSVCGIKSGRRWSHLTGKIYERKK